MKLNEINPVSIRKVDNEELISLHHRLHELFGRTKEYSKEDISNLHALVVAEMLRRNLTHNRVDEIDDYLPLSKKMVTVVKDFICFVGSYTKEKDTIGDLDVLIRADKTTDGFVIKSENIELPLRNMFDPNKNGVLHYIPNPQGAHSEYIPVYDLVLVQNEDYGVIKKGITPFRRYNLQKPYLAGYTEFFSADELWKNWAEDKMQKSEIAVSPKMDGFRTIVHKSGDKVKIYFEDQEEDYSDELKIISDEAKLLTNEDYIIEGELLVEKDEKTAYSRPEIISYLSEKYEGIPYLFVYDILYFGSDISKLPFSERYAILKKVFSSEHIITLPQYIAVDKSSFFDACEKAVNWKYHDFKTEGVVARKLDMPYTFGSTDDYAKYKLWCEIKVRVEKVDQTKNGYTYTCSCRKGNEYLIIGKTFVTNEKIADVGDTISVMVEEIILNKDGSISWGKPKVMSRDVRPSYTLDQIIDLADRKKCLKRTIGKSEDQDTRSEIADRYWQENWYNMFPENGKGKFVYQLHFRGLEENEVDLGIEELLKRGRSVHGDLRFTARDGTLWGFTVFLGDPSDVLNGKNLTNMNANFKLQGAFKLAQPDVWLKIGDPPYVSEPNEVGSTSKKYAKFFKVDEGEYKVGVWRQHLIEIFMYGNKLKGRYLIEYAPIGKGRIWLIEKPNDQTPYAEKNNKEDVVNELREKHQKYLVWSNPNENKSPELVSIVSKYVKILKGTIDHYVLAPVLVPNEPDWYGDVVDEREIRNAASEWLNNYRKLGILHKELISNDEVVVTDSFVAPTDIMLDNVVVKKGTWLLGVKILSDELWKLIEAGDITGFSIDGMAMREELR